MCVLCGELIMTVHWTDQPLHDMEYKKNTKIVAGSMQRQRMRTRLKRAEIANRVLQYYGLSLKEFNGSRYILFDKKGSSQVIYDLGTLWKTASDMCHKQLDPLDPVFLEKLLQSQT